MIWVTTDPVSAMDVERAAIEIRGKRSLPFIGWATRGERLILTIDGLTIQEELQITRGRYREEDLDAWEKEIRSCVTSEGTTRATLRLIKYLRGG